MWKVSIADANVRPKFEGLEEDIQQMEEEKHCFSKMQHDSRVRSRVYEKMLTDQEHFWKGEMAEKEEQLGQLEREREEWRSRETFWISEMETLMQRGTEGTTWVMQNFAEAYRRLEEGMISLEDMKLAPGDKKNRSKERRWRKKEREDRMASRASVRRQREEREEDSDDPRGSLRSRANVSDRAAPCNAEQEQTWNQQAEQMDGKWSQVKNMLETMRENVEQRSIMGSTTLRHDYMDLYGRLAVCRRSMDRVRRELDDTKRRKEFMWRRLGLRMQMGGREEEEEEEQPTAGLEDVRSPRQTPRRRRDGRSRGRQTQKDEV